MPRLKYTDLARMPTLAIGQAADLKLDTGTMRVWVSRMTVADGETQPIYVEIFTCGRWIDHPDFSTSNTVVIDAGPHRGDYIVFTTLGKRS